MNSILRTQVTRPVRPNWITSQSRQALILVMDVSWSMVDEDKALKASAACEQLIQTLAAPINQDGFYASVIHFGGKAKIIHPLRKASELLQCLSPLEPGSQGEWTDIHAGLKMASKVLNGFDSLDQGRTWLRPVTLFMSDGEHNKGKDPLKIAPSIKADSDLVTVAFGEEADEDLLTELATSQQHFYRCSNGSELRCFLAAVGQTMSQTRAARTNATMALTTLNPQQKLLSCHALPQRKLNWNTCNPSECLWFRLRTRSHLPLLGRSRNLNRPNTRRERANPRRLNQNPWDSGIGSFHDQAI